MYLYSTTQEITGGSVGLVLSLVDRHLTLDETLAFQPLTLTSFGP